MEDWKLLNVSQELYGFISHLFKSAYYLGYMIIFMRVQHGFDLMQNFPKKKGSKPAGIDPH